LSHDDTVGLISAWSRFEVIDNTEALPKAGLTFRASAQLSLWDALIVAAAVGAGCEESITEVLDSGENIAGVRIINPFLRAAA
jgi:predicted nucleic acid-binding protein